MIGHPADEALQRSLDEEHTPPGGSRLARHLVRCERCRARREDLGNLLREIRSLPGEIEPPLDLWPTIAGRIDAGWTDDSVRRMADGGGRGKGGLVVLVGAVAATLALGIGLGRGFPRPGEPIAERVIPDSSSGAVLASYELRDYETAIAELQGVLFEMRDDLRPETVAVIEENLRIIDVAIAEARAAVEADPANEALHRHIGGYMQAKLEVLRSVTGMGRDI